MSVREVFATLPNHSEISYEMTFDAGHRIVGHKGKCARLHGHTYKIHIMAAGLVVDPGFVIDFGDLKDIVNKWDHKMLLWEKDPCSVTTILESDNMDFGVVRLPFNPTAENMAQYLAIKIYDKFPLYSIMVELWETPKCMARYVIS